MAVSPGGWVDGWVDGWVGGAVGAYWFPFSPRLPLQPRRILDEKPLHQHTGDTVHKHTNMIQYSPRALVFGPRRMLDETRCTSCKQHSFIHYTCRYKTVLADDTAVLTACVFFSDLLFPACACLQMLVRFIGDRILSLQAPMRSDSSLAWLKVR